MKTQSNIVKFDDNVVICKDYDRRIDFKDGYVVVKSNSDKQLNSAEVLYYLELACQAHKNDIMGNA